MNARLMEQLTQAAAPTAHRGHRPLQRAHRLPDLDRRGLCVQCGRPVDRHFQRGSNGSDRFRDCGELARTMGAL
jgi:hypothetical protein